MDGWAYLVKNNEGEQAFKVYGEDTYEVVRCLIHVEHGYDVVGLTFRSVG